MTIIDVTVYLGFFFRTFDFFLSFFAIENRTISEIILMRMRMFFFRSKIACTKKAANGKPAFKLIVK